MRSSLVGRFAGRTPPMPAADRVAEAIGIDANGSPVTIGAATWLICFVPGLRRQWWHRFAHDRHKHVFALRPLRDGTWLLVEPWWTRMMVNVLTLDEAIRFLRWGAMGDILKVRESIPGRGSQMRGWANCSVLVSFMLGRAYWTWTPNGLYRKLRAEAEVEPVELTRYLRAHFMSEADRQSARMLKAVPSRCDSRIDDALVELGTAIVAAMTSVAVIDLHKAAVSQSRRYHDAAEAYWTSGPGRAVRRIRKLLVEARRRGEIGFDDCELAARRFLAMLRGNLQLEIVLGQHPSPGHRQVREHVEFVVAVFLRGAGCAVGSREAATCKEVPGSRPALAPAAHLLVREVGESIRDIVRGDDWDAVAGCAEALWGEYASCTGLAWSEASERVRRAWERSGARRA